MKSIYSLLVCTLLFSSTLFGYTRGLKERIDGVGDIAPETTISLGKGVTDFRGVNRDTVTLNTPHTNPPDSTLILDSKRSIFILDSYDLETLEPGLINKIKEVVSGNAPEIEVKNGKYELEDFYIMANFVHHMSPADNQDFFIAIVPKDIEVERIIFQLEWFGDGAGGHTQVRMIMDRPIVLIPQKADVYTAMTLQNNQGKADIVYSLQAARVQGGNPEWNPIEGIMGEYANALQFFSVEAKAKKQIFTSVIEQFELTNLDKAQKRAIFDAARINSDSMEETKIYNTILNSCVSHAILALRGNENGQTGQYLGIKNIDTRIFNPYTVINQLRETIINDFSGDRLAVDPMEQTLNQEFSEFSAYGTIKTEEARKQTEAYRALAPIEKSLFADALIAAQIEDVIRKIAIFIVDNNITYDEVLLFVEGAKKVANGELSLERAFPQSEESQTLYKSIETALNDAIDGDDRKNSLLELLTFLTTVQTQDLETASKENR